MTALASRECRSIERAPSRLRCWRSRVDLCRASLAPPSRLVAELLLSLLVGFVAAPRGVFIGASPGLVALEGVAVGGQSGRLNTWSATSSTGRTLMGTWTAVADQTSGAVSGTWTLADGQGRTVTRGVWSAAKSPSGWTGAWRAAISGSKAEYSGTWSAGVQLKTDARLVDLFEQALQTVVSGNWRAGRQSGAWSIRAFK